VLDLPNIARFVDPGLAAVRTRFYAVSVSLSGSETLVADLRDGKRIVGGMTRKCQGEPQKREARHGRPSPWRHTVRSSSYHLHRVVPDLGMEEIEPSPHQHIDRLECIAPSNIVLHSLLGNSCQHRLVNAHSVPFLLRMVDVFGA
jgi:hypothetical protein